MKEKNKNTNGGNKKVYSKPSITQIRLVADEAVLALCKWNNGVRMDCRPDRSCVATWRS